MTTTAPFIHKGSQPHATSQTPSLSASYLFSDPKAYNSSLQDVLTVYRKPGTNRQQYLNKVLAQTKKELKSNDFNLKMQAAFKLLFLFNEGIDI